MRFSCWMGAYPTLSGHFAAANLDPQSNMWDKVRPADGLLEPLKLADRVGQHTYQWGTLLSGGLSGAAYKSRGDRLNWLIEWGSIHLIISGGSSTT